MSARHESRDGFTSTVILKLNEYQKAILDAAFDTQTDYDIEDALNNIREIKLLRKLCWYNVILFIPQYTLTLILFGKEYAKEKKELYKISMNYLRNKINIEDFKKGLQNMVDDGKIL